MSFQRRLILMAAATLLLAKSALAETLEYRADLTSPGVILGGQMISDEASVGTATFILQYDENDPSAATITYQIDAPGMDFDGAQTPDLNDDATAIHFHDVTTCVAAACIPGDTAGTRHVLNVFGAPREDDADMQVFASDYRVTGTWGPEDANSLTPAPSVAPSEIVDELANGDLFAMIHSRAFPDGAIGGKLVLVPEPSSIVLIAAGLCVLVGTCRRRR